MPYVCYLGVFYLFKFFLNLEPQSCWTTASFFNSLTRCFNGKGVAWIVKLGPTRYSFLFVCLFVRLFVLKRMGLGITTGCVTYFIFHQFLAWRQQEQLNLQSGTDWADTRAFVSHQASLSPHFREFQIATASHLVFFILTYDSFYNTINLLLQGSQKKKDAIVGNRQKLSSQKHGRGVRREFN